MRYGRNPKVLPTDIAIGWYLTKEKFKGLNSAICCEEKFKGLIKIAPPRGLQV